MKAIIKFLKEVRVELDKVTWPKKDQVIKLTLIVFIISGVIGLYLGMLDFSFTKLLELLIAK
ncbi:MAG: preprotein translocase subunit SecE [Patescibacteria group bacterium]